MGKSTTRSAKDAVDGDKILTLVAAGQSITQAGESLGIQPRRAQRLYHRELQHLYESKTALRQELLAQELKTLDLLQRPLMLKAMRGETKAAEVVLSIMDRRSKYLGLDQAAKVQVEVTRVDEALREITQIIDGEVAAKSDLDRVVDLPGIA